MWSNVFLNADLAPKQRKQDYDLRIDHKRRRVTSDLVTRNREVITKSARSGTLSVTPTAL